MIINFSKSDTFFTIIKTFQKLPDLKSLTVDIDPDNEIFRHQRRWEQIKETIASKNLDVTWIVRSEFAHTYCVWLWFNTQKPQSSWSYKQFFVTLYSFFFRLKTFQFYLVHQKNTLAYIILGIEWLIVWWLLYFIALYLIPSAVITITPAYEAQDFVYNYRFVLSWDTSSALSIPVKQATLTINQFRNSPLQNIRYSAQASVWTVTIYNTLNREYTLKPFTRLITNDWLLFRTTSWVQIPKNVGTTPWQITVQIESMENDEAWQLIWKRWNIPTNTYLYIRNLRESRDQKKIYALSRTDFSWWVTLASWVVTQKDIDTFRNSIATYLSWDRLKILVNELWDQTAIKPLLDRELTTVRLDEFTTNVKPWDQLTWFWASFWATLTYHYVAWTDILRAVKIYLSQRQSSNFHLIDIDKTSVIFYDKQWLTSWVFIVPTKVSVLRWYNFIIDPANYQSTLLKEIAWKSAKQAESVLLWNPDIAAVTISTRPFWINTLPSLQSRIRLRIINPISQQEINQDTSWQ